MTRQVILSDISTIIDCEHKTAPLVEDGIPSIRTPNIGKGRLLLQGVNRVDDKTYKLWTKRGIPESKDLILAREAPVGNVAIIQESQKVCLGQRTVLIKPKHSTVCAEYLNYLLNSRAVNDYLVNISNGATVGHLNVTDIRNLMLPNLPAIQTQRKIAAVLSAYDDLIENNNRRIAILEKMAKELYREWFVRLRFPGHEKIKIVKGVPEGWEIKKIGEVCIKVTDGAHASPAFVNDGKYMASVKDMTNFGFDMESMKTIGESDFTKLVKADCQPLKDDILIAKDGSYLKHVFVWDQNFDLVILSSIAILRPNKNIIQPYFFSLTLKQNSIKSMMAAYVSGSALPRIILNDFKKMPLLVPEKFLIIQFENKVRPIYQNIKHLLNSISYLKISRDRLLTRLMSGKMDVENLDIRFPKSMEESIA